MLQVHHELTASPFVCRYEWSNLVLSVKLSSSSEPSKLSKALALATGDLGEVGLIRCADLFVALEGTVDLPTIKTLYFDQKIISDFQTKW